MSGENWRPEEWDQRDIDFQGMQYLGSRGHCTVELLEAISGIAPAKWGGLSPRHSWIDKPVCGYIGHALVVTVHDVRAEVTCPRCRSLMRALRPESAPLHERIRVGDSLYYLVGGEPVKLAEYVDRLARRAA